MKLFKFLIMFLLFLFFPFSSSSAKENKIYVTPFQNKQILQSSDFVLQTEDSFSQTPTLNPAKSQNEQTSLMMSGKLTKSTNTDLNGLNAVSLISAVDENINIILEYYAGKKISANSKIAAIMSEQVQIQNEMNKDVKLLDKKDGIKCFILGCDYKTTNHLYKSIENNNQQIKKLIIVLQEIESEGEKQLIRNIISSISNQNVALQNRINYETKKLGLFGIFLKLFGLKN